MPLQRRAYGTVCHKGTFDWLFGIGSYALRLPETRSGVLAHEAGASRRKRVSIGLSRSTPSLIALLAGSLFDIT
jgi:hypothetical protein